VRPRVSNLLALLSSGLQYGKNTSERKRGFDGRDARTLALFDENNLIGGLPYPKWKIAHEVNKDLLLGATLLRIWSGSVLAGYS